MNFFSFSIVKVTVMLDKISCLFEVNFQKETQLSKIEIISLILNLTDFRQVQRLGSFLRHPRDIRITNSQINKLSP
jgi:hypothetical protein